MAKINTSTLRSFANTAIDEEFLQTVVEWVGAHLDPEDVFDEADLENWAINSGFVEDR